ncbi:ribonuclease P protein subunit p20 isoform X1 [Cephus cinctus]|uniref:Ribonuclease P protein subunit p20 n=1 Tax=Cephus cinctus TaxID=211228 RepID=A0AAJ7FP31_CEPCN|nr:ribonuclease P protein subunit p20 isoform X1 [Cephus cinctus]
MAEVKTERKSKEICLKEVTKKCPKNRPLTDSKHILRKRLPVCQPKRNKDIYVTNKTSFKAQLNKCEKLLDAGEPEVIIHGLGAAINRACNLALQLKENHHGTVDLDINTSTVDIIDDFEPLTDDADYEVNNRQNSAIHIRVFRTALIGTLKYAT